MNQLKQKKPVVVYVAGCSGGHIFPAITLASKSYHDEDKHVVFVTTNRSLDLEIVKRFPWLDMRVSMMRAYPGLRHPLKFIGCVMSSCAEVVRSIAMLHRLRAERVVSTGGYVALPLACAARLLRIPCEVYELNVEPGKAVMMLAKLGCTIGICFPQTQAYFGPGVKTREVAYPLRFSQADKISKQEARAQLGIPQDKKVLFVVGGSQGSKFFNVLMQRLISASSQFAQSLYIVHQTGVEDIEMVKTYYTDMKIDALVAPFFVDMPRYYQAADVVLSRAGAGVLAELVFFDTCAAIIPLETGATAHQKDNARAYAELYPQRMVVFEQAQLSQNLAPLDNWLQKQMIG